jgi:hypothetical protein
MNYNMTLEQFLEQLEFCLMYGHQCGDCPGIDAFPCAVMILDQYKIVATKEKEEYTATEA